MTQIKLEGDKIPDFEQPIDDNILNLLKDIKQTVDTAPTYIPKTFLEQIVFYESGGVKKLYLYMNNVWIAFTSD